MFRITLFVRHPTVNRMDIIEIEAEIATIEDIIQDNQKHLEYLTDPCYDQNQNVDHEYREADIEYLQAEILAHEQRLEILEKALQRMPNNGVQRT